MEKLIKTNGSIQKKEILIELKNNILNDTCVLEATHPYANYYGRLPHNPRPNSLFLLTKKFFYLEEILGYSIGVENCVKNKVDFASAILDGKNRQYPAIRIKNFPDYKQLRTLQQCLIEQGVLFENKCEIPGETSSRVNKIFWIREVEQGVYMDKKEANKGYVKTNKKLLPEQFKTVIQRIRNNGDCKLFDAVQGEFIIQGDVIEIVRVFSEAIDLELLRCLKQQLLKLT